MPDDVEQEQRQDLEGPEIALVQPSVTVGRTEDLHGAEDGAHDDARLQEVQRAHEDRDAGAADEVAGVTGRLAVLPEQQQGDEDAGEKQEQEEAGLAQAPARDVGAV